MSVELQLGLRIIMLRAVIAITVVAGIAGVIGAVVENTHQRRHAGAQVPMTLLEEPASTVVAPPAAPAPVTIKAKAKVKHKTTKKVRARRPAKVGPKAVATSAPQGFPEIHGG